MPRLNKLRIFSVAKLQAVLGAYVGLLCGILYSFGGLIYDLLTIGLNWGTLLAFGALIGMPIIFGAFALHAPDESFEDDETRGVEVRRILCRVDRDVHVADHTSRRGNRTGERGCL